MRSNKCWRSSSQVTVRYGNLTMCRKISGTGFGVISSRSSFSIILLWGVIRREKCRRMRRKIAEIAAYEGNTKKGNNIMSESRRGQGNPMRLLKFCINLFPKKVEYAILLQKSCLMSGRTSELGREILKYSWQENNFNRHHRRTGGEECSV